MADVERRLISQIILTKDMLTVNEAGVQPEWFATTLNQKVFAWLKGYWQEHRRTPTRDRLADEYPDFKFLYKVADPLSDCVARQRKQRQKNIQQDGMIRAVKAAEDGDSDRATDELAGILRQLGQETSTIRETVVADVLDEHIAAIRERRNGTGIVGIPTGFATIDQATHGLQPGQFITVLGLAKAGKSTLEMLIAQSLQRQGYSPYFVNFEMSESEQLDRYVALGAHISYDHVLSGELTDRDLEKIEEFNTERTDWPPFRICTDTAYASTISGLEAMVTKSELPDALLIDGIYFMRDEISHQQNDSVSLTNITRETKKLARRLGIPVIATHQALESKTRLREKGGSHRVLNMYSGGYSSSFAQDSDFVFGLERDEQKDEERLLRIVAARTCALRGVWVSWDWRRGYFGTENYVEQGPPDDEEYDDEESYG